MIIPNFHIDICFKRITPYIFLIKFTLEEKKRQSANNFKSSKNFILMVIFYLTLINKS